LPITLLDLIILNKNCKCKVNKNNRVNCW